MASDDTEITLGMGKLLGLFFLLAAICGVFFSIGYSLGKSTGREQALNDQPAAAPTETVASASGSSQNKPSAVVAVKAEAEPAPQEQSATSNPQATLPSTKRCSRREPLRKCRPRKRILLRRRARQQPPESAPAVTMTKTSTAPSSASVSPCASGWPPGSRDRPRNHRRADRCDFPRRRCCRTRRCAAQEKLQRLRGEQSHHQ